MRTAAHPGEIYLVHFGDGDDLPLAPVAGADIGLPQAFPNRREVPRRRAVGVGKFIRQSGGKGQYGHVVLELEPNERKKGISIAYLVSETAIPKQFADAVVTGVRAGCEQGPKSDYPVSDAVIRIVDGSFDPSDSSELAFKMAAVLALRDAMNQADSFAIDFATGTPVHDRKWAPTEVRPAVVISRDDTEGSPEPIICVPLTTQYRPSPYEIALGQQPFLDLELWASVRGVAGFDRKKLKRLLGCVSSQQLDKIKSALRYSMDL